MCTTGITDILSQMQLTMHSSWPDHSFTRTYLGYAFIALSHLPSFLKHVRSLSVNSFSYALFFHFSWQRKLKQQDKALLRQFLDLRATIHGYLYQEGPRPRIHSYGCPSDESDAVPSPAASTALLSPDEIFVEFRPRTVSLLGPKDSYHLPVRHRAEIVD